MDNNLDKRYQTLVVLWFAMLMSVVMLLVFSLFAAPTSGQSYAPSLVTFALAGLAAFMVVISFAVKRKLLERSVENQDVLLVQKALVIACAMCEVAAIIGLMERFLFIGNDHYLLFAIAAIGTALHFPRREQLAAAAYKGDFGN